MGFNSGFKGLIVIGDEVGNVVCDEKEKHEQAAAWSNTSFFSLALSLMLLPVTICTEDAQSFFHFHCMFLSFLIL